MIVNASNRLKLTILAVIILLPLNMGGCPEFRNESINALETASRGVIDAAVTLYFDQLRTDDVN